MDSATLTRTIFIDGEAGTTGLGIAQRLAGLAGVAVRSIAPERRKDPDARREIMSSVDLVVLCLPDAAAKESVALADTLGAKSPKIIDASSTHRVAPGWTYGFPEMTAEQTAAVRNATRVANPGCYPTGGIALIRPLVEAGVLPADWPVTVNAISGYSGGGKSMIAEYEARTAPDFELYGLGLEHKHLPELHLYSKLTRRPIFVPSVGDFRQGMLVSVPLHLDALPSKPKAADIQAILEKRYAGSKLISVVVPEASGKLEPQALNGTDRMELRVFANEKHRQAVLVARLDNLGKGASGAAVQNISLMLGLE
ncbi:MAG: N-acetyl-gamma-glutamyl-phosphate reductase [Proteobacteria bacterium]|nr:N-acetyl-gamma-glutamyl-phosphate reductase [Pseudomonadota bacterium]